MISTSRIDTHAHFCTADDLARVGAKLPYAQPAPHPLAVYLDTLIEAGVKPALLNNVHLSILPDSENVFASFLELAQLQKTDPVRYGGIRIVGTILADPAYATAERLAQPQVKGIRIVLHDAPRERVDDEAYNDPEWQRLFRSLRPDQHIHVYAEEAGVNLKVLLQLPDHIPVLIDHLGTCHSERGADDPAFCALLGEAVRRGNVYFKGPGYRTAMQLDLVLPFVVRIAQTLGSGRLLLEATDAPHVGGDGQHNYADMFSPLAAFTFATQLARAAAEQTGISETDLLRGAAAKIFSPAPERETMCNLIEEEITFTVTYRDGPQQLHGRVLRPASPSEEQQRLPPVVFNSGFTGGASMYGQLVGKALAERGYRVMTYDVAGFFKNKNVRNTFQSGDRTVTHVSLEDQKAELLSAIFWARQQFGRMPVVSSWAMGSVASLAAIIELARQGGEQVPCYIPMNYSSMSALQNLRATPARTHAALSLLPDNEAIPPFDTGTQATRLGYYPLDPATQAYVDGQLGGYTAADGVEQWPGCTHVSARSYKESVAFDPEAQLAAGADKFPPALIIHGAQNTLHMPEESIRLHQNYPGKKSTAALMVEGFEHGQQMEAGNPIFLYVIENIDNHIRAHSL